MFKRSLSFNKQEVGIVKCEKYTDPQYRPTFCHLTGNHAPYGNDNTNDKSYQQCLNDCSLCFLIFYISDKPGYHYYCD
jgi:hypothetical protein